MAAPNVEINESIWLVDYAGSAVTGKTQADFTISSPRLKGTATTATLAIAEAETEGGEYEITWTPTAIGRWDGVVQYNGSPRRTFAVFADVEEPIADAVLAASVTGGAANTVAGKLARIGTLNVVTGPVDPMSADRTVVQGDAETLTWSNDTWTIAADAEITMTATYAGVPVSFDGMRVNATTVSVALTAEQTGELVPGRNHYRYSVKANDDVLVSGAMSVERS